MVSDVPSASAEEKVKLFDAVEARLSATSLQPGLWYLLVQTALVGGGEPSAAAQLYLHLVSAPDCQTSASRQALVRRLREALVKSIIIQGLPKQLEAILAISSVEQEQDKDHTFTRKNWETGPENSARAMARLERIYQDNVDDLRTLFKDHEDFVLMGVDISYGLFLADEQILNVMECEVVVLAGLMMQNLPRESHWHLRAFRRLGASKEDAQAIIDCTKLVAEHLGMKLDRIAKVEDVEGEL